MSEQAANIHKTDMGCVTEVLPETRRKGEGITEFTMRQIQNEVIERCARAAEGEYLQDLTATKHPEDMAYDSAIRDEVEAIRRLKR